MIHVIIKENLIDREFVKKWTFGFDKLAEHVSQFTPEWAEEITWVPAEKIRQGARLVATTKPATLEWGCAIEHTPNSIQTVRAVSIIPAITGNIDCPGGWVFGSHVFGKFPFLREHLPEEARKKRLGAETFKILGEANVVPSAHIPAVFKAMRTGEPYPIKAFLVFGNNPLSTYASSRVIYESLKKVEFYSVMDLFMTPSAELADLVLPAASWLELDCATGFPFFADCVALAQQKIVQIGECKQDELVFVELARRMNLKVGQESIEEIFDTQLVDPYGVTFKELKERGFVHQPISYYKYRNSGNGFDTESGKIELYSLALEKHGYSPLPVYVEPPESPLSAPEMVSEYPYVLTTGARVRNFFTSEHRQLPRLRKGHPEPLVELHPDTAKKCSIAEGEWVWIETKRGRIRQKAKITEGIDPRVVHVEFGWWFPERKDGDYGIWESNANVLTNIEPPYDPAIGTYQLRALLCRVYKEE
jgi:anaerobic selenocysteine-containing dehydrogenase